MSEARHGFPVLTFTREGERWSYHAAEQSELVGSMHLNGGVSCVAERCDGLVDVDTLSTSMPAHCDTCGADYYPHSVTFVLVPPIGKGRKRV